VKRRFGKQRQGAVTPQVVAAYEHALAVRKRAHLSDADKQAAHEAERIVDRLLGFKFFEDTIWDIMKHGVDPKQPHSVLAGEQLRQLNAALRAKRTGARNANLSKAAAALTPMGVNNPDSQFANLDKAEGFPTVQSGQQETEASVPADADP
jgi:hypothetical protein